MKEDLISVIVTVYNMERVLPKTLDCINKQTYQNLEIILVDDGSTDASGAICDTFATIDSRCRVIHKKNGGQGSAINSGIDVANGTFLFFPDADDFFSFDIVRVLYSAVSRDTSYDIAITRMISIKEGESTDLSFTGDYKMSDLDRDDLIEGLFSKDDSLFIFGWNKLYKRELLTNIRYNDYSRHGDFDFNFRVFVRARKAVYLDVPLYYWVQWPESKTHQSNTWDLYYECRANLLFDNWKNLPEDAGQYEHYLLDALYRTMVFWEEWSRKSGNFHEVKAKCKEYTDNTKRRYVRSLNIGVVKRAICLSLLAFPGIAHWIMKITNNAR